MAIGVRELRGINRYGLPKPTARTNDASLTEAFPSFGRRGSIPIVLSRNPLSKIHVEAALTHQPSLDLRSKSRGFAPKFCGD